MRRTVWKPRRKIPGSLRAISAWAMLQAQQEARFLAPSEAGFALCLNACVLARALQRGRAPLYSDGEQVLRELTEAQIRQLCERYLERFDTNEQAKTEIAVNPSFDAARYEELKRQWQS